MRLPAFSPSAFSPLNVRATPWLAAAIISTFVLAACSQPDPPLQGSSVAPDAQQATANVSALMDAMLNPSSDDAAAKALAATPALAHSRRIPVRNQHQPSRIDSIEVLDYSGVTVAVYEVSASGKRFIQSVRVAVPNTEFMGISVGMPIEEARVRLQASGALELPGDGVTYLLQGDRLAPAQVMLEDAAGKLGAYTVSGYLD